MSIILSKNTDWTGFRTAQDVVFTDPDGDSFALSWLKADAQIAIDEMLTADEMGISGGSGFFKISGKLSIAQNVDVVLGQLQRLAAQGNPNPLFSMQVLFRDQVTAMSATPAFGTDVAIVGFFDYLSQRYPLINDWTYAVGIRLGLSTSMGGSNMVHSFILEGFTFATIQYRTTPATFYAQFPTLQR